MATWVEAAHAAAHRAGQFFIQLEADSGRPTPRIEQRIIDELRRLAGAGPTAEELARSRHRIEAAWRWEQEDLTSLAAGLGPAALWDDWRTWQAEHRAALSVEADDIRRVVATYLIEPPHGRLVACRGPLTARRATSAAIVPDIPCRRAADGHDRSDRIRTWSRRRRQLPIAHMSVWRSPPASRGSPITSPRRMVLDNGLRLIFERRPALGVVALELYADAGFLREAKPGLACLTGRLLEEGTTTRTARRAGRRRSRTSAARSRSARPARSLRVRARTWRWRSSCWPTWSGARLPRRGDRLGLKHRIAAELRGDLDDPAFRAELSFRGLVYGAHPLGRDPRGGGRDLARLTRHDVVEHHRRHFVPENAILVAGRRLRSPQLVRLVKRAFGDWPRQASARPPVAARPASGTAARPPHPSSRRAGPHRAGPPRRSPATTPISTPCVVLDHIFGSGPGFSDRLGRIVRDEMGLVYAIGGGMTDSADLLPGLFRVYAGTMPDEAERVVATITDQVRAMRAGAFSRRRGRPCPPLPGRCLGLRLPERRAARRAAAGAGAPGPPLDEPVRLARPDRGDHAGAGPQGGAAHIAPESLVRLELGPIRRRGQRSRAECA